MTPNTTKQLVARSTCSYVFRKSCFRSNRGSSGGATSYTESSQPYGAAEPVTEAAVAVCRWRPGEGVLILTKGGGVHLRRAIGAGMGCAVQGRAAAPRSCRRCSCCRFPSCWASRDGPPGVSKPRKVVNIKIDGPTLFFLALRVLWAPWRTRPPAMPPPGTEPTLSIWYVSSVQERVHPPTREPFLLRPLPSLILFLLDCPSRVAVAVL